MLTTKLDLKKFLEENKYELAGPYDHQPEDAEVHYNIFCGSADDKRCVGGLWYPDKNESPMQGKISIGYKVSYEAKILGANRIILDVQQIRDTLAFREVLDRNNIPYKEDKKEAVKNLREIKFFLDHTSSSLLEDLARMIG